MALNAASSRMVSELKTMACCGRNSSALRKSHKGTSTKRMERIPLQSMPSSDGPAERHGNMKNQNTYLQGRHNALNLFTPQLQHSVQDANLVVPQWFSPSAVELEQRLQFGFLVRVAFVGPEREVEEP